MRQNIVISNPGLQCRQSGTADRRDKRQAAFMGKQAVIPELFKLKGVVQHYEWGGFDFIPKLLNQPPGSSNPCAELWLGSHPNGPSVALIDNGSIPLPEVIAQAPDKMLGEFVASRHQNRLPYLFKVLDARQMLSIQAHPTLEQAAEGFDDEERARILLTDPARNYKDRNHKPEVQVALTEFWMLHGFRPLEEIAETLETVSELRPLMPDFRLRLNGSGHDRAARSALLRELYERAMTMPQGEVDRLLDPLVERLERQPCLDKDRPDFWAARAAREFQLPDGHRDRGIFSIYLLNLLHLNPGEATYQPAGTLHAYLEGVNVELMANSDNVLRGGLTPKRVDVQELMKVLRFTDGKAGIIRGQKATCVETVFPTPADDFELSRIQLAEWNTYRSGVRNGPDIIILIEGAAIARSDKNALHLRSGEILFSPQSTDYTLEASGGSALAFKATTSPISRTSDNG